MTNRLLMFAGVCNSIVAVDAFVGIGSETSGALAVFWYVGGATCAYEAYCFLDRWLSDPS